MGQIVDKARELKLASNEEEPKELTSRLAHFAELHPVLLIFLIALGVRVLLAVLLTIVFGGSLVPDDSTYSSMARDVAEGNRGHWDAYTHELFRSTFAFLAPVALIYSVVGPEPLAGQLFVGLLGALTAAATTAAAMQFLKARWPVVAGLIVALLPSQALWSSLILKDAAVWFTLSALAVVVAIAARSTGWRLLSLAAAAAFLLVALAHLREHTLVVACFALAVASLAGIATHRLPRIAGATALAVGIPWLVGIGPAGFTLVTDAGSLEQRRILNAQGARTAFIEAESAEPPTPVAPEEDAVLAERIAALQAKAAKLRLKAEKAAAAGPDDGTTAEPPGAADRGDKDELLQVAASLEAQVAELRTQLGEAAQEQETTPEASGSLDPDLAHLPTGLFVMLFEPVPWETGGSSTLQLARLEALVWYPLLILAVIGLWISRKHLQSLAFPLLAGGGMLVVYALTEGNIGTAFRHRGEFVWVVALLAALGLRQVVLWRQQQRDRIRAKKEG